MRKHAFGPMHPANIQICICVGQSESLLATFWIVKDAKFLHADIEDSDRLHGSSGSFESPLGAHVRRYVFSDPSHLTNSTLKKKVEIYRFTSICQPSLHPHVHREST